MIMNQSVIDMCASFVLLLPSIIQLDVARMSPESVYDQFVCRVWFTRVPLWALMTTSTYGILIVVIIIRTRSQQRTVALDLLTSSYGILITAIERYIAVIYPIWYNVRMNTCTVHECTIDQELAYAATWAPSGCFMFKDQVAALFA